jgi:Sec-independent protein translocase protein TatA
MLGEIFGLDGVVVLAIIAVVLFGGAAIPKLARNLGSAKNQFEKGLEDGKQAVLTPAVVVDRATAATPVPVVIPVETSTI